MDRLRTYDVIELDSRQHSLALAAENVRRTIPEFKAPLNWSGNYHVYAATNETAVLGIANVMINPRSHYAGIRYLAVPPEYRRQNVGSALLERVIYEASVSNCARIGLCPLTPESTNLYRRYGFAQPDPKLRGWYKVLHPST